MEWYRAEIDLNKPCAKGSKVSKRDHFAHIEEQLGRPAKDAPIPIKRIDDGALDYLLDIYRDLAGFEPLTFTEIHCWSQLTGVKLKAWELDVIKALDRIRWGASNDE